MGDINRRQTNINAIREIKQFIDGANFAIATPERLQVMQSSMHRNFNSFLERHNNLIGMQNVTQADINAHEVIRKEIEDLVNDMDEAMLVQINQLQQANANANIQANANANAAPIANAAPNANANPPANANPVDMRYLLTQRLENTWGTFDGTITKWPTFRDMFKSAVHDANQISNVYKFQLLTNSLRGQAAEAIQGWNLTNENYTAAWQRLNELYDRPNMAANELTKRISELPVLTRANAEDLQRMSNVTNSVQRQLQAMGRPIDPNDLLLISMIENKLDIRTRSAWERERQADATLRDLLAFIDKEARALPNFRLNPGLIDRHKKFNGAKKRPYEIPKREGQPQRNGTGPVENKIAINKKYKHGQNICPIRECKLIHEIFKCPIYLAKSRSDRVYLVKQARLCLNCLEPGHLLKSCTRKRCKQCNEKHNSTLCPANPFSTKTFQTKMRENNEHFKNKKRDKYNERFVKKEIKKEKE